MADFKNENVFISGASRGIGAAIARYLAKKGYNIWLNYSSSHHEAAKVKQDIENYGSTCRLLPFDVSDEEAVNETLKPLLAREKVYGMIHNAGIIRDALLPLMKQEMWDRVLDVHLNSFYSLAKIFSLAMLSEKRGRIISIASVSGETGQAGQVNYSAAKAGLIGASKALAREFARKNILVNVVSPGLIETDMTKGLDIKTMIKAIPQRRMGTPEEVAGVVRFLLSNEADYITGQVISVNGGMYM